MSPSTAPSRTVSIAEPMTGMSLRAALRRTVSGQTIWIFLIFVGLILAFSAIDGSSFASVANARNILASVAILLVLSLGQMLVILTAGIDLSSGGVLVFSGVMAALVINGVGGTAGIFVGVPAALAAGAAWGAINGLMVAYMRIPPIIATLGSFGMSMGLALVITGGIDIRGPLELVETLGIGDIGGAVPYLAVVAFAVAVIVAILLSQTRFGRHTYAVGASVAAAERCGIRVKRHLVWVYALAGLLTGLAGYLALSRFGTTTIAAHAEDSLKAITAVVLGGTSLFGGSGTVRGTVIGAFIPVILLNGFVITGVQVFWQQFAIGLVLVVAVFIDQMRHSRDQG